MESARVPVTCLELRGAVSLASFVLASGVVSTQNLAYLLAHDTGVAIRPPFPVKRIDCGRHGRDTAKNVGRGMNRVFADEANTPRAMTPNERKGMMDDHVYTSPSNGLSEKRHELAPDTEAAFREFSKRVFADGALSAKMKQLVAVAVAHVTQCPYCIRGHTKGALRRGATDQEIMEAIWVAAEMRAGGAFAHSVIALEAMEQHAMAGTSKVGHE